MVTKACLGAAECFISFVKYWKSSFGEEGIVSFPSRTSMFISSMIALSSVWLASTVRVSSKKVEAVKADGRLSAVITDRPMVSCNCWSQAAVVLDVDRNRRLSRSE